MYAKQNERNVLDIRALTVTIRKGPKSILVEPGHKIAPIKSGLSNIRNTATPGQLPMENISAIAAVMNHPNGTLGNDR